MASSANWELQKAIYQALTASTELTTLLGGPDIYDHVPQKASYPYITLGQTIERDWSTSSEEGSEHLVTLHVWSQNGGRKVAQEILAVINAELNNSLLTVSDHHLINIQHEFSEVRRDPDDETFHGICRYRATTEPV